MFKKILVPIDLGHAERVGAMMESIKQIASLGDTQFVLLNVIPDVPGYIASQLPPELHRTAMAEAKAELQAKTVEYGLADSATVDVKQGNPFQTILKRARDHSVDLIVIGSHQPGPTDYLLGSVASKVVRHASCSVMVVR